MARKKVTPPVTEEAKSEIARFMSLYPSRQEACKALGVSSSMASYWCTGFSRVSADIARKMEELSGGAVRSRLITRCKYNFNILPDDSFGLFVIREFASPRCEHLGYDGVVFLDKYFNDSVFYILEKDYPEQEDYAVLTALFGGSIDYWAAVGHAFWEKADIK